MTKRVRTLWGMAVGLTLGAAVPAAAQDGRGMQDSLTEQLAALRAGPESADRFAAESRLHHFLAEAAASKREAKRLRKEGQALAERALALEPKHPDGLMWWVAHRGTMATALNPIQAIKIAADLERTLLELRALAPDHEYAAADRVLGKLYQIAPAVISVGSMTKAKFHYEEAMRRAPDFPGNRLFYAEYLLSQDECAKARAVLNGAVTERTFVDFPLDAPAWQKEAQRLRQKLSDACD